MARGAAPASPGRAPRLKKRGGAAAALRGGAAAASPSGARLPPKVVVQQLREIALQLQAEPGAGRARAGRVSAGGSGVAEAAAAGGGGRQGGLRRSLALPAIDARAVGGLAVGAAANWAAGRASRRRSPRQERRPLPDSLALLIHDCRPLLRSARGRRAALRCCRCFELGCLAGTGRRCGGAQEPDHDAGVAGRSPDYAAPCCMGRRHPGGRGRRGCEAGWPAHPSSIPFLLIVHSRD